jgi:TRAP-type C4-dicarboxylate transport system permease small subunit
MWRAIRAAAVAFALVGGAVLVLVAAVTVVSVGGRWLLSTPVLGDVELVQLGTAAALALFLPYCQLHGSHLIVDIFTARTATSAQRWCWVFWRRAPGPVYSTCARRVKPRWSLGCRCGSPMQSWFHHSRSLP